eukprot:PhM_4_TR7925/c0_g1_i1/m.12864/K05756/ARPC3; actin related protein 2/3 complex, subunit 3
MAYHSAWNDPELLSSVKSACGCGMFPLRQTTKSSGSAPKMEGSGQEDIVDETLKLFRANSLFKAFEMKGAGDRMMVYLMLYTQQCLKRLEGVTKDAAQSKMFALGMESFPGPGEAGFPLTSFYPEATSAEVAVWKDYAKQARMELGARLIAIVYASPEANGTGNKHWMQYSKETILGKTLEN